MREKLKTNARRSDTVRSKLIDTARRLIQSERDREQSHERARQLEEQLASSRNELEQRFAGERRKWEQERSSHETALAKQKDELEEQAEKAGARRDSEWEKRFDDITSQQKELSGYLEEGQKQRDEAKSRSGKKDAKKFNNLGVTSFHNGAYEMARDQFLQAVKVDPEAFVQADQCPRNAGQGGQITAGPYRAIFAYKRGDICV